MLMFDIMHKNIMSPDRLAEMLKTDPERLRQFEASYAAHMFDDDDPCNIMSADSHRAADENGGICPPEVQGIISRIAAELSGSYRMYVYNGKHDHGIKEIRHSVSDAPVTEQEIKAFPEHLRAQLTGNMYTVQTKGPAYAHVLILLDMYLHAQTDSRKKTCYGMFRQGLDIMDLDPVLYQMLGKNPASMGNWIAPIADAVDLQDDLAIPETKILTVPLPILQLSRIDYEGLTRTTLDIVDRFCRDAFSLDENNDYFIKTGIFSSKYDFRNAHVHGAKEVREIGEYLLFITNQAVEMCGPLVKPHPFYGVATTNEWVVRRYIGNGSDNGTIYKGLPLRTEYRIFADFDTKEILGMSPYWEPGMMKARFDRNTSMADVHDAVAYRMAENRLMQTYDANKDRVRSDVQTLVNYSDLRLKP